MIVEALLRTINIIISDSKPCHLKESHVECSNIKVNDHNSTLKRIMVSKLMSWLNNNGFDLENLLHLRYCTPIQNDERNKVLWENLWGIYIQKIWITSRSLLPKYGPRQTIFHEIIKGWRKSINIQRKIKVARKDHFWPFFYSGLYEHSLMLLNVLPLFVKAYNYINCM